MKAHILTVVINGKVVHSTLHEPKTTFKAAKSRLQHAVWMDWRRICNMQKGEKTVLDIQVTWTCTMNERAPARPKDVIAGRKSAACC